MKKMLIIGCVAAVLAGPGCSSDETLAPNNTWADQLAGFQQDVEQARLDIAGDKSLNDRFGNGAREVGGDGTFVGEGSGTATLSGVGVVFAQLEGTFRVQGTLDIAMSGFDFVGNRDGSREYTGNGYFTATSDEGQEIEVVVEGSGQVIGAGTGVVLYSGEGFSFWYH